MSSMLKKQESKVVTGFANGEISRKVSWKQSRHVGWVGRKKLRVGWFQ